MYWILLAGLAGLLIYYFLIKPHKYWQERGVPQSKPWPLLGDNWGTFLRLHSFADSVQMAYDTAPGARYAGIYQIYQPTLVLKDPELIKQITVKDFDHFTDHRGFIDPEADPLWGKNLFALRGTEWRDMRITLSPSFTSSKMRAMFKLINEASENFVDYFLKKDEKLIDVEMKDVFTRFTNDVIATAAFGVKVDSLTDQQNEFYVMGKEATDFSGLWKALKFFGYLMAPKLFKLLKSPLFSKSVSAFFRELISDTIKTREEQGIVRPDMINILMEARKGIHKQEEQETIDTGFATVKESTDIGKARAPKEITDEDITAQALIFFFAGFDAVSNLMSFTAYELATNPEVQDKLRTEIKETLKECNGKLTYEALLKMKYMDMVISESLRKWPPAIVADRACTKPYTIQPTSPNEKPVKLEKNSVVWIPTYGIHRDPQYFQDPEKFVPERFSEENKDNIRPYTYLPFGAGPRNCIGSRFALLETKAIFFYILSKFEIVPTKKSIIPLKLNRKTFNFTAEGGFWFGFKRVTE